MRHIRIKSVNASILQKGEEKKKGEKNRPSKSGECSNYLVSSADEIKVMFLKEFGHFVSTKCIRYTSVILPPALNIIIWISPQKITKKALIWHISRASNITNLIQVLQVRR